MKNDKLLKILLGIVLGIFVVSLGFIGYSSFSKKDTQNPKSTTQQQEKTEETKSNEEVNKENKTTEQTETIKTTPAEEQKEEVIVGNKENKNTTQPNISVSQDTNALVQGVYNGKKLSRSEGIGTTGKVFKTQKEAYEYGSSEIERLVKEDKKPRQFSISKVTAEDGELVGWTVDIFEDINAENNNE